MKKAAMMGGITSGHNVQSLYEAMGGVRVDDKTAPF